MPRQWTTFFAAAVLVAASLSVSCAAKVNQVDYATAPTRPLNCPLDIYPPGTPVPYAVTTLAEVSVGDTGFSVGCDSTNMMRIMRERACEVGADAIQLYDVREPSFSSTCFQGAARLLRYSGSARVDTNRPGQPRPEPMSGTGTAFVVDPSGVLLTAHHVIDQATSITVSCNGRPPVPVTVTSSSPTVDLAVLTAASGLGTDTFLRLTPTQQPALGDEVFTVGYPTPALLGRDPKYTNGTVSALSGVGGDASFMQISVPVQPGNSGGPLLNQNGEVIGIVVATADAPAFIQATDSIPQNINWAVKSVFASALFTPPAANAGTDVAPADVIAHVTDATCLVEATGAAQ